MLTPLEAQEGLLLPARVVLTVVGSYFPGEACRTRRSFAHVCIFIPQVQQKSNTTRPLLDPRERGALVLKEGKYSSSVSMLGIGQKKHDGGQTRR